MRELSVVAMPTVDRFVDDHVARNEPVVVTGLEFDADAWTPHAIGDRLGDLTALVYGSLFDLDDIQTLGDYLGDWFGLDASVDDEVPYVRWYNQLRDVDFAWGDEAFRRLHGTWRAPACLPAQGLVVPAGGAVDPTVDPFPYRGVLVAARGARTRLHRDPFGTDAVVCQFYGTKHAALYRPERAAELTAAADTSSFGGFVDVRRPDGSLSVEPDFEGVVQPGEMIYIPHGWLHDVLVTDDSLSITWNFIHPRGSAGYRSYLEGVPDADSEFEILRYFSRDSTGEPGAADLLGRLEAVSS